VFEWHDEHAAAGFSRNAIYLIRPDTYVALAETSGSPETIEIYFKDRGWESPPLAAYGVAGKRSA
jgi:hypothetical protein